ncbi:MAG: VanZ family protein, partial [Flavobacteriaceae bacterium]
MDKILKFKFRIAFVFWVVGITTLSLAQLESDLPSTELFVGFDKVVHALFYFGFTFLLSLGFVEYRGLRLGVKQLLLAVLIAASYGLLIEYLQQEF